MSKVIVLILCNPQRPIREKLRGPKVGPKGGVDAIISKDLYNNERAIKTKSSMIYPNE